MKPDELRARLLKIAGGGEDDLATNEITVSAIEKHGRTHSALAKLASRDRDDEDHETLDAPGELLVPLP